MNIILFNNGGLIVGKEQSEIACSYSGVLKIGNSNITIKEKTSIELPILCDGKTGEFGARFTKDDGTVYNLVNVHLVDGIIAPPADEIENFVRLYKTANRLDKIIEQLQNEKQEAINGLNNHPLKYLIDQGVNL